MQTLEEKKLIEHIRFRPGMYLGTLGNGGNYYDGIYRMFQEILNFSIDEFRQGYGNIIEVQIEDNHRISIRDYGRGISYKERTWNQNSFLRTTGVTLESELPINIVKALCSQFDISYFKDNSVYRLNYDNGILKDVLIENNDTENGTLIVFTPDENIFKEFRYVEDIVFSILRDATYLNTGLDVIFNGIRMRSTDGMFDLVKDKMPRKGYYLYPVIHFKNDSLDIAITHSRSEYDNCYSFVNGLYTNLGGTHLSSLKKALSSVFLELYPTCGFVAEDVYSGMVIAISINMEHPMFDSVNRWKLGSLYFTGDGSCTIEKYIHAFFCEKFKTFLLEHPDISSIILEKITLTQKHRKFAQKCLSMSIDKLVELWNDGIENKTLGTKELYAIRDAFLAKKVQTIEMQRSNAIVKRLKIGYDKVFNIIHCSGRFFSETDGVLLPF